MSEWTHRMTLGGVDITALTAIGATVDEGENSSHVCDFIYYPESGVQDSDSLVGKAILIDVDVGSGWAPLFTGSVIRSTWDTKSRLYAIRGSTRLQEYFRALGTVEAVREALPGAVYSEALFGEPMDDLWEYAQKCMETIEQDVHLDRVGLLEIVDWASKPAADHALAADNIHNNGHFLVVRPDADESINEVTIVYEYRVRRFKVRGHHLSWRAWVNNVGLATWCEWAIGAETPYQFKLPDRIFCEQAMMGGSWNVADGISVGEHPPPGSNYCATQGWSWTNPEPETVTSSSATGYRALSQPIWETYTMTFSANAAMAIYGEVISDRRTGSTEIPSDPAWPPQSAQPQPDWAVDTIGDSIEDQTNEADRQNDLQSGYQWAKWRIRGSLRVTSLAVRTNLNPDISLEDTVSVDCYGLQAKGKVRRLRYVLDAAPYLEMTMAISRGGGGTDDPWTVPDRPDTAPTYPAPPVSQSYSTHVGGYTSAPEAPDPDDRLGWMCNVRGTALDPGAEMYGVVFRIQWPEIEDAAAQEIEKAVLTELEISVPQDVLVIQ